MSLMEYIPSAKPDYHARDQTSVIIPSNKIMIFSQPTDTQHLAANRGTRKFSLKVHIAFWLGIVCLVASGLMALGSVLLSNELLRFIGVLTLSASAISLLVWIEMVRSESGRK